MPTPDRITRNNTVRPQIPFHHSRSQAPQSARSADKPALPLPAPTSPAPSKQSPTTFPTSAPVHIISRPALPGENPTPAEIVLEALIFDDATEKTHAQGIVNTYLGLLDAEKLPLNIKIQLHIRTLAQSVINATRATNYTRPRDDGKRPPAAMLQIALRANEAQRHAIEEFDTLLEKHRLQNAAAEPEAAQLTPEQQEEANRKEIDSYVNDLRIPIRGLARNDQPNRLKAISDTLATLDKDNQDAIRRGQPIPYVLPVIPTSLIPATVSSQVP